MKLEYRICSRCVMDTSDPDIQFDINGHCNHCTNVLSRLRNNYANDDIKRKKLNEIITKVKQVNNTNYDCIIGLSGGIDSSYLAYVLVKEFGLRPLAVHVDNGWNSEQSVTNIHNIVNKLNIDLITHVIDWDEFKALQKAFIRSSVVDLEMLSDNAIIIIINKIAKRMRIKYFLIGANYQTESIMPRKWFYPYKKDSKNIKDIYSKFGTKRRFKTFPFLSFFEYLFFGRKYGIYLEPLSYMNYNKEKAKTILQKELDWQDYGSKHHESFITKFYQTYILPRKYNIDKRRAHYSSLICADQISREEALKELSKPMFQDDLSENEAIEYFCKKMDLTLTEFENIMNSPLREHSEFKSFVLKAQNLNKIKKWLFNRQK